jgi:hypothetical protein
MPYCKLHILFTRHIDRTEFCSLRECLYAFFIAGNLYIITIILVEYKVVPVPI